MRNLAAGNKMNFTLFAFIVIIILVILGCAAYIVLGNEKEEYQVDTSAFIYDSEYNYINLENPAILSKKWTGNYYLKEKSTNKDYKLGDYAILFNTNKKSVDLYGEFYQVLKGGDINKISGYNIINNSVEDKFYKIDDRRYLIIARDIENDTGSLSTQNYLIIVIDKLGNALLLNNEINAKTINEMIISTNDFEFDVANEILTFNKEEIDLKKIIGSTNEYKPREEKEETEENEVEENNVVVGSSSTTTNNTTNNNSSSTTIIQNGSNINAGNVNTEKPTEDNKWVDSLNNWIGNVSDAFESIYDKENNKKEEIDKEELESTKSIALNSVNTGTTFLDINYTINDPDGKYNVVYAIISDGTNSNNISLDKTLNTYRVTGLNPNTSYSVQIGYKVVYGDATSKDVIEDTMVVRTTYPTESLKITKVSLDRIYYTLKLDSSFIYDNGAKLNFYISDELNEELTVTLTKNQLETAAYTGLSGSIEIPEEYIQGTSISINLEDTKYNGKQITTNIKAKIINY